MSKYHRRIVAKLPLLLLIYVVAIVHASEGDLQPYFDHCVDQCVQVACPTSDMTDHSHQLLHWTCNVLF